MHGCDCAVIVGIQCLDQFLLFMTCHFFVFAKGTHRSSVTQLANNIPQERKVNSLACHYLVIYLHASTNLYFSIELLLNVQMRK